MSKKTFHIGIREVHVRTVAVEAETVEEALEKANRMDEDEIMLEYSHCMDMDSWTVEEVE
jgi:hypothetical protein